MSTFGTFEEQDVRILLKDITWLVEPLGTAEREAKIQSGTHYCEMLPVEYEPTDEYLDLFWWALKTQAKSVARAAAVAAEKTARARDGRPVLVSLARAGTSAGILMKRYMEEYLGISAPHYTISIIRGRGIDENAVRYILEQHAPEQLQFVDGWTGKGAIAGELKKAAAAFDGVGPGLSVLADPAWISEICGTHEDLLIPSSCLNSTVSGLLSRTFLRSDIIGLSDFHGAAFYKDLAGQDLTKTYIDTVAGYFDEISREPRHLVQAEAPDEGGPIEEVRRIANEFGIADINLVKPGVGEATRVLLRRVPWKVLVQSRDDDQNLGHLYRLAREKNVPVEEYPLRYYRACGIIRELRDV